MEIDIPATPTDSPAHTTLLNSTAAVERRDADHVILGPNNNVKEPKTPGCNAVAANATCYVLAAFLFVLAFNIPQMYALPSPLIANLLPRTLWNYYEDLVVVALIMWGLHFIRRFTEVLFVHTYSRRQTTLETVGASLYYGFFALWNGWALNYHLGYMLPHPAIFYPGVILFVIGEVGNCAHHVQLRLLSKPVEPVGENRVPSRAHVMPQGLLFNYVSCPHYFFEILTWIGFFLATFVLPALLFVVATIITLVFYASRNHQRYKDEFHEYPANRKALIPFIY